MINQEYIKTILSYDCQTGIFTWKVPLTNQQKVGQTAGSSMQNGYKRIGIHGKSYLLHRLAWLYCYGEFPQSLIDHVDGNKANNKISNLRLCSSQQNSINQKGSRRRKGEYKGVKFVANRNKYVATIKVDNVSIFLGSYSTAEHAAVVRLAAEYELFGDFTWHEHR